MYFSSQRGAGLKNTKNAICAKEAFKSSGALSARSTFHSIGSLPNDWRDELRKATDDAPDGGVYVVYSYSTPIAWHSAIGGWVVPDVKYSATTSRHQSVVRGALAGY